MEQPSVTDQTIEDNNYIEADFRTVELCKKFIADYGDIAQTYLFNPFTQRKIKRGKSTCFDVYQKAKKYLSSLDDEEFHSPIKNVKIKIRHVDPPIYTVDDSFDINMNDNRIIEDWTIKAKLNCADWIKKMEKKEIDDKKKELMCWRNDIIISRDEDFEKIKENWIIRCPEIYSFLDTFKPEVLENKFLMHHVFQYDDEPKYFILFLQNHTNLFLSKDYGYGNSSRPHSDKRYAASMITFWIYAEFIKQSRKYLKKHSKKLQDYLASKPTSLVRITKNNLNSLCVAFFINRTPPDLLQSAQNDYDKYFTDLLNTFFQWCERESVYAKRYYSSMFLDFMASRIKPYRYISLNYDHFERFDEIIEYVSKQIVIEDDENNNQV